MDSTFTSQASMFQLGGFNPNRTHCPAKEWTIFNDWIIYNPSMIVSAGLGILVGFYGFYKIFSTHKTNFVVFGLTFATFGCMNTSGLLVFTTQPPATRPFDQLPDFHQLQTWLFLADATFSSATSAGFIFCGIDIWNIPLSNTKKFDAMVFTYVVIFSMYLASFLGVLSFFDVYNLLYIKLTGIGSAVFFLSALAHAGFANKCVGLASLLAAFGIGIFGLVTLQNATVQQYLCHLNNGYFNGMDFWYIESDLSLFFLMMYYFEAIGRSKEWKYSSNTIPLLHGQV